MGWGRPLGAGRGGGGVGGFGRGGNLAICREPLLSDLIPVSVTKPFSVCMHADSAFLVQEQSPKRTAIAHKTFLLNGDDFENC